MCSLYKVIISPLNTWFEPFNSTFHFIKNTLVYVSKINQSSLPKGTVENFVLLKCRNSEEKTRRLRIRSSAEFLYSMTCVVICSHRRSHLKSFLQGIFIVRIGGGTFFRLRQNIKAEGNKPNESTSGQDKVICRIKVQSLSSH